MTIVFWGILLSAVQLAAGIVIGRCLPRGNTKPAQPKEPESQEVLESQDGPGPQTEDKVEGGELHTFACRLHELLAGVAGDVDAHQDQIRRVNEHLNSVASENAGPLTDAILRLVTRITRINEQLQGRLNSSEEKLQEQAELIRFHLAEARTDQLTQLPNRRAFDDEINRRVAQWRRKKIPCGLMMVDIDHFKAINDLHGHPLGDVALRAIASVLADTVRETDIVTRFGGEEFAVVLPATDEAGCMIATERVRLAVEATDIQVPDASIHATVSLGLAITCEDDDAAALLDRADKALYAAKQNGRNRGYFHSSQSCELIEMDLDSSDVLPRTISAQECRPTVSSDDGLDPELRAACDELRLRLADFSDPS